MATRPALAQRIMVAPWIGIGSEADERLRLDQLRDSTRDPAALLRSPSTMMRRVAPTKGRFTIALIAPDARAITNSAIPLSLNEGTLWAGRGTNTLLSAGLGLHLGPVHLVVAPQLAQSENRAFQVIPYPLSGTNTRSIWANPFHPPASSIDLPLRFGDQPLRTLSAGESSLTVDLPGVSVVAGTEHLWWGPGVRNAIVLSNNAPGVPHLRLQTRDGITTRIGRFDGQWILGQLRESDVFDVDATNNRRTLSGLVATFTPAADRDLTIGVARTVTGPMVGRTMRPASAFNVFTTVGQPNTTVDVTGPMVLRHDQISALFVRWAIPAAGAEAYAEWARFEEPRSVRDLLEFPGHSQGYTLGAQWARPLHGGTMRVQVEATNLEPDASLRVRPVATTYTSRATPQGYTHLGRSLGAAIGPGSSSQFATADWFGRHVRVGAFVSRIRWDNAVLWESIVPQVKNEDISLSGGLRGSVTWGGARLLVEYTSTARLDYLFQDAIKDYAAGTHAGVDLLNRTLAVTLSTHVGR